MTQRQPKPHGTPRHTLGRGQAPLLAAMALVWTVWVLINGFSGPHFDISAIFMAGWLVGAGQADLIYAAPPDIFTSPRPGIWAEVMENAGLPDQVVTAYVYPPIWAWLAAWPAHALGPATFFRAALVLHMAALAGAAALSWSLLRRLPGTPPGWLWGVALFALLGFTVISLSGLVANQPQITVIFLILLAFWLAARDHSLSAGIVLGLAAAFKLTPILFVLLFVTTRNWRALVATFITSGSIAVLSIAIMGWPLHMTFLDQLSRIDGLVIMTKLNPAPEAALYEAWIALKGTALPGLGLNSVYTAPQPLWLTVLTKGAFLAALAGALLAPRNLLPDQRLYARLLLLSLASALFGPLSWSHYFILPLLMLPVLFSLMPARTAWIWIGIVFVATSQPVFIWTVLNSSAVPIVTLLPMFVFLALFLATVRASHRAA